MSAAGAAGEPRISTTAEDSLSLATAPATSASRRLALAVVVLSSLMFATLAPFARMQLPRVEAFIPIYESVLVINDLITAVLLFGQFNFLGSRALLVLCCAYLFTAFITVAHALSFPGLFAPAGLLSAGAQGTAWIYMFWHGFFPVMVTAYAFMDDTKRKEIPAGRRVAAGVTGGLVTLLAVWAFTLPATSGQHLLPAIMQGNRYVPAQPIIVGIVWLSSVVALIALWRRKRHTVLGLWLMVVLCAWLFDIALAAFLNAGRFDLGFYSGRIYGLLASGFVLVVLLYENNVTYARLVSAHENERRERALVVEKTRELMALNKELDSFSYSVSHDLRAPLRAVDGYARILEEDYGSQLDAEGNRLLGVVRAGSAQMARLIDDLLAFSRIGRVPLNTQSLDLAELVRRVIDELRNDHAGRAIDFKMGDLGELQGDPALLKHVLVNLIGNAVKFTGGKPQAVIEIGKRQAASDDCPVYYVKDNGAGFDMKYYDKLFGVFQRLHSTKEFPGTGVGLAIVNRVVARHDGRVWAESKQGEGATFYFTLGAEPKNDSGAHIAT